MNIFHCSLLNRHWFFRASEHWKDLSIVAFATGIFKKMPRYFIYKNNTLFNRQKNKSGIPCLFTNLKYISSTIDMLYCQQFRWFIFDIVFCCCCFSGFFLPNDVHAMACWRIDSHAPIFVSWINEIKEYQKDILKCILPIFIVFILDHPNFVII